MKKGSHLSEETKLKISLHNFNKGKTLSAETRKKMREAYREKFNKGIRCWNWKGDDVGYKALHKWVTSALGKISRCMHCGSIDEKKRYEWANVSHEYKREESDWIRLCKQCHRTYDKGRSDIKRLGLKTWLKW